jgi:integrative and conjugative element protein (TIGR02256 family)
MRVAWLAESVYRSTISESTRRFPLESGGVFLGYQKPDIVILDGIGPGPLAVHKPSLFAPDYEYQEQQISARYRESGRIITYLGDWHSHPNGSTNLSRYDKATLRRIGLCNAARVHEPIMCLVSGKPGNWTLTIWQFRRPFKRAQWITSYIQLSVQFFGTSQNRSENPIRQ